MAPALLTCRIRVKKFEEKNDAEDCTKLPESAVISLRDCFDVGIEVRTKWAEEVIKNFANPPGHIRAWDFIATAGGSVKALVMDPLGDAGENAGYPARFQIPLETLWGLDEAEKVRRVEMFARASLLYEIFSGTKPFEDLTDEEVQDRFRNGKFPDDAISLPHSLSIYSGWSEEFAQELTRRECYRKAGKFLGVTSTSIFVAFILEHGAYLCIFLVVVESQEVGIIQAATNYAKAHPIRTGIQVAGLTLTAVSMFAVPVLGLVGFTSTGPAAGSAARAWQASIGVVRAGSLFSWCQSVAMGGAALGGIKVAGVAGAALTRVSDIPGLAETFHEVYRTAKRA